MKTLLRAAGLACAALIAPLQAGAQALPPPEIAGRAYLLVDMNADQVLAEHEADAPADPASLTKLMTAYIVFVALHDHKLALDQRLPVSQRAWAERKGGGSLMFIDPKMTPTVDELLQGLIVDSGNDAAVALAEGVAGSTDAFVGMMNRQAQAWGLKNTTFRNVTGLTEAGHRSTARDMVAMAEHIVRDYPEYYHYYAQRDYTFNNIRQDNRNLLLERDPSVDGMKTGYTEAAGWCLLASAQRDFPNGKRRLMAIVMGADSMQGRANETQKLLNWGFTAFDDVRLVEAGKAVATVPVWKGRQAQVGIGSAQAIYVAVPKGEGDRLKTQVERTDPLVAPLASGQRVGQLKVATASGTAIAAIPLTVLEPVPEAGLFGRAWDALRLWIK
ncbi:MAG TPA: D-alanyl-D-alanine carboxypeptidase family protein [Burkholderiaceae bacterium]